MILGASLTGGISSPPFFDWINPGLGVSIGTELEWLPANIGGTACPTGRGTMANVEPVPIDASY